MSIASIFGLGGSDVVKEIGDVADKLFTSDDERAVAERLMEELRQRPIQNQHDTNMAEAGHRSVFVAGWRPFIGWVCGLGLMFPFVINPCIQWYTGQPGPEMPTAAIIGLVGPLLGLGTLRTFEKLKGLTR